MRGEPPPVKALTATGGIHSMGLMRKPLAALALCLTVSAFATDALPGGVETVPAAGGYVVNSDSVNVRAAPDVSTGKVVGRLNKGAGVEVVQMTVLTYAVQGMRAAWFRVKSPDGWVFGYYLDPVDSPTRTGEPPAYREER
jgi:hypothetical protein